MTAPMWGWYSPRMATRAGTLYYEALGEQARPVATVMAVPCVEVTTVTQNPQNPENPTSWPDIVRTGPVGRYVCKGKPSLLGRGVTNRVGLSRA